MIHQSPPPSTFHQNSLTHLLSLHSASVTNNNTTGSHEYHNHTQTLSSVNEQIGKSFTIAAILGLKKNNPTNPENSKIGPSFSDVMNLSINQNPNGKFDLKRIGQNFGTQIHQQPPPTINSALQSLQQLQQHQANSAFHIREKQRDLNKKSTLKSKRVRTIFTPEQLERLEAEFERQQYMVGPERLYLAHSLQLTEAQVKVWFQNRRIKWRKHHLEITHQRLALLRQQMPNTSQDNTRVHESELTIHTDSMTDSSRSPQHVGDDL